MVSGGKIRLFTLNMINFGLDVECIPTQEHMCEGVPARWCLSEFGPDHIPGRSSFPAQSGRQLLSLHWSCSLHSL